MLRSLTQYHFPSYSKILLLFVGLVLALLEVDPLIHAIKLNQAAIIINHQVIESNAISIKSDQAIIRQFAHQYPQDPDAYRLQGLLAYDQNDIETMISSLRTASNLSSIGYQGVHNWLFLSGENLLQVGDIQRADLIWTAAIEIFPTEAAAYFGLGKVFVSRGEYEKAEATFREGIKIEPNQSLLGLFLIGQMWVKANQFERAIPPLFEIVHSDQKNSELDLTQLMATNWALGVSYNSTGDQHQAIEYFSRTIDFDSQGESEAAWAVCDAILSLGHIYNNRKDTNRARTYYEQVESVCKDTNYSHQAQQAINDIESP